MFERFSQEARAAVVGAQEVGRTLGSRRVHSGHLLAALLDGGGPLAETLRAAGTDPGPLAGRVREVLRAEGLDADALADLGIDLDAVRRRADQVFGEDALDRAAGAARGHLPFTRDAKKVLELALREAIRLEERRIEGRHLLLGILRCDNPGRAVLVGEGVDLPALRRAAERGAEAA